MSGAKKGAEKPAEKPESAGQGDDAEDEKPEKPPAEGEFSFLERQQKMDKKLARMRSALKKKNARIEELKAGKSSSSSKPGKPAPEEKPEEPAQEEKPKPEKKKGPFGPFAFWS